MKGYDQRCLIATFQYVSAKFSDRIGNIGSTSCVREVRSPLRCRRVNNYTVNNDFNH